MCQQGSDNGKHAGAAIPRCVHVAEGERRTSLARLHQAGGDSAVAAAPLTDDTPYRQGQPLAPWQQRVHQHQHQHV